tara:strand:+ start:902 stop:1978 length:1077 start_codon:yes stop_codon:yes gene_type:complete
MDKKIYTRQELYDLVWNQSLTKLATKFHIEPHRLKEICAENEIPLPTRGYWSKVRFNKKIVKPTLPKIENENPKINLDPKQQYKKFRTDYHRRAFELEQRRDLNFKVPVRISTYHPLIRTSKKLLEKIDNSEKRLRYWEVASENDLLPIHTDLKLRDRALRFMDTLIKIVEAMGCKIVFYCNSAHVEMFGQKTEINLRQKVYRIRTKDESGWSRESWEKSDKLEFQAGPSFNQKKWIDNTKRKLEECLPEIIAWIEKDCRYWHDLRARQTIEENKRLLQQQKIESIKEAEELEQSKVNQLLIDSENWNKAQMIERYVDKIEKLSILAKGIPSHKQDYITWARKVAYAMNPLNTGNESQ